MKKQYQVGTSGIVLRRQQLVGGQPMVLDGFTLEVLIRKPGSTALITKTAIYPTPDQEGYKGPGDGTDGAYQYVIEPGVLDKVGDWRWQGRLTNGAQVVWSPVSVFEVLYNA